MSTSLPLPLGVKELLHAMLACGRRGIASCIRWFPGAWSLFGIPGRPIRSLKWWVGDEHARAADRWSAVEEGPHYVHLSGPVSVSGHSPRTVGNDPCPPSLTTARHVVQPEVFLTVLPGGRVLGSDGTALTADGRVIAESIWPRCRAPDARVWTALWLPSAVRLPGSVYTIACYGGSGYYHWLMDVLPRLMALEAVPAADSPVVVNGPLQPWHCESLRLLGIDEGRLIPLERQHLQADVLLLPSLVGDPGPHPLACRWLRERLLPPGGPARTDRRLYVTRRLARGRRVTNEAELEPILKGHGFEVVEAERMTFADQVRLFSEAAVVAGPHGAGLTNTVFAPEGCKVLELFQPTYTLGSNYKVANCLGHEYWYLLGRPERAAGQTDNTCDMWIDPDMFAASLEAMGCPWVADEQPTSATS